MKLYYIPAACSLSPHIVINELGLDVDLVKVDHKTHHTDDGRDFRELSPFGYVPLLELDDGTLLREGSAIVQYLADMKPQANLAPAHGSLDRYRLQEWLGFLSSEIHKGFIPLLYARLAGAYGTETAKPKLEQRYRWIDEQLATCDYLMGHYSVADAYLYSLTQWGQAQWLAPTYKADIHFDELENLRAWYLRMRARPAVRRALDAEGLV
ncbi:MULTISPECIES: glutathione S-transferase N-terminal domain-containing protein [unclassified Achromobacter]|uniref:glutathione S-transferase N-terminal domain-containing protein n=1 Tax=unclassified Achromobacter TaxID=2626865 RepID=UPI000B51993C|nr:MULTISPECIES: glutathione S-transferase N-terminal domain-containing protein [unclassified Achromobacter]OWT72901.1 glutathione S-transferase [Achromobacter sp. HZ34]OWT74119.1 glutathione S-transferase [Achromobacter sp. HZ28]